MLTGGAIIADMPPTRGAVPGLLGHFGSGGGRSPGVGRYRGLQHAVGLFDKGSLSRVSTMIGIVVIGVPGTWQSGGIRVTKSGIASLCNLTI